MFITKKTYKELVELRDEWRDLAIRIHENNKCINKTSKETLQVAKEVNDDNKKISAHCKHLESEVNRLEKEIKALLAFKNYFSDLYGHGLEVANWHQNGELEPFDNFYESAEEEYENA